MLHIRKNMIVNAAQVTLANMFEIARQCGGYVTTDKDGNFVIHLTVVPSRYDHAKTVAGVTDWIVQDHKGFKIYTDRNFRNDFEPEEVTMRKREKIIAVIEDAMGPQNFKGQEFLEEHADKIMDLFL